MSRGFVKEEDQEEDILIPPRAALPAGETNYVTPDGYQQLLAEREQLDADRKNITTNDETERRRSLALIDGKFQLLSERIASARMVDLSEQPKDEVRFGATVKFKNGRQLVQFQIVGVDEADIKRNKVAFTAPIARALNGAKVGETVEFKRENEVQRLEVVAIKY
ncbi:MAG: transcription elongation factor GreA [Chryseobacterium sp.]|nr:MAG: transcription elongation factor GreA [Chryseobacterium sp.]